MVRNYISGEGKNVSFLHSVHIEIQLMGTGGSFLLAGGSGQGVKLTINLHLVSIFCLHGVPRN
jgi:hypothetical protein